MSTPSPKVNKNCVDNASVSNYYCNKESIRETFQRSYMNQMQMDEILTYAYSSDENNYQPENHNTEDTDCDSLGTLACIHALSLSIYIYNCRKRCLYLHFVFFF